jgi:hypothetical protein
LDVQLDETKNGKEEEKKEKRKKKKKKKSVTIADRTRLGQRMPHH